MQITHGPRPRGLELSVLAPQELRDDTKPSFPPFLNRGPPAALPAYLPPSPRRPAPEIPPDVHTNPAPPTTSPTQPPHYHPSVPIRPPCRCRFSISSSLITIHTPTKFDSFRFLSRSPSRPLPPGSATPNVHSHTAPHFTSIIPPFHQSTCRHRARPARARPPPPTPLDDPTD